MKPLVPLHPHMASRHLHQIQSPTPRAPHHPTSPTAPSFSGPLGYVVDPPDPPLPVRPHPNYVPGDAEDALDDHCFGLDGTVEEDHVPPGDGADDVPFADEDAVS